MADEPNPEDVFAGTPTPKGKGSQKLAPEEAPVREDGAYEVSPGIWRIDN